MVNRPQRLRPEPGAASWPEFNTSPADVAIAFRKIGGRRVPTEAMCVELAQYIDAFAWQDVAATMGGGSFYRRDEARHDLWLALRHIERASAKWLGKHGQRIGAPAESVTSLRDLAAQIRAATAESVTSLRDLAAQIRAATYPPHYGKRHERWHDVALHLAPMIRRAYQAAGRRTADFQTSTSDGVKALEWCLSQFGHSLLWRDNLREKTRQSG